MGTRERQVISTVSVEALEEVLAAAAEWWIVAGRLPQKVAAGGAEERVVGQTVKQESRGFARQGQAAGGS